MSTLGNRLILICLILISLGISSCEETDLQLATEAGIEAFKSVTLSDEEIQSIAVQSALYSDQKHQVAIGNNPYNKRLLRLVENHYREGPLEFNYKVYLSEQVNAFAMADGTIRIYSGLMDMMNDGELRFVIGHEMGHVVKDHIKKKVQLAYAASAIRKGIASQNSTVGDIARSQLGGITQKLLNAQFSQFEEKEADDYGLKFLKMKGYPAKYAVSALRKLGGSGKSHSLFSTHPDSDKRADRIQAQIDGTAKSIEETKQGIWSRLMVWLETILGWALSWI